MPKTIIITGDKALDRKFQRLGDARLINKIARANMRKALKPIVKAWKANAPKDTGAYKAAIGVRSGKRSRVAIWMVASINAKALNKSRTKAHAKDVKQGKASGDVKSAAPYVAAIEYGDEDQKPQAPGRRAYDSEGPNARDNFLKSTKADVLALAKR